MIYTDNSGQPYVEADDGTLRLVSLCHEAPLTPAIDVPFRCSVCSTAHDYYADLTPDISEREHRANANSAD